MAPGMEIRNAGASCCGLRRTGHQQCGLLRRGAQQGCLGVHKHRCSQHGNHRKLLDSRGGSPKSCSRLLVERGALGVKRRTYPQVGLERQPESGCVFGLVPGRLSSVMASRKGSRGKQILGRLRSCCIKFPVGHRCRGPGCDPAKRRRCAPISGSTGCGNTIDGCAPISGSTG